MKPPKRSPYPPEEASNSGYDRRIYVGIFDNDDKIITQRAKSKMEVLKYHAKKRLEKNG